MKTKPTYATNLAYQWPTEEMWIKDPLRPKYIPVRAVRQSHLQGLSCVLFSNRGEQPHMQDLASALFSNTGSPLEAYAVSTIDGVIGYPLLFDSNTAHGLAVEASAHTGKLAVVNAISYTPPQYAEDESSAWTTTQTVDATGTRLIKPYLKQRFPLD